jgi:hypothetical protein
MFAIPGPEKITKDLDSLIEWYAPELRDDSYTAAFEIISYLYYGGANEGLAEIRKTDALAFLSQYRPLVPVVSLFVKHSGSMEQRFRSLFSDSAIREEDVKAEEEALEISPEDAPLSGSNAMFWRDQLDTIWTANPSHFPFVPKYPPNIGAVWNTIIKAATACSTPSASKRKCVEGIDAARLETSEGREAIDYLLGCTDGIPRFKNWMKKHFVRA